MFPVTPAAEAALSVATRFYSPALLNHCVRSYRWGAMYGTAHGIAFDDELFYVSALLHDIGLTEAFDSYGLPFEEAGGRLAWVFGVAAGWPTSPAGSPPTPSKATHPPKPGPRTPRACPGLRGS